MSSLSFKKPCASSFRIRRTVKFSDDRANQIRLVIKAQFSDLGLNLVPSDFAS
jgi:uncharacterized protein (DUF2461 family)